MADEAPQGATVLYDDNAVTLTDVRHDPANPQSLWVRSGDLPRINQFELKPQGACRADMCIPISKTMVRDHYFNLTAFAEKLGEPVVGEPAERVWSLGELQMLRGAFLESRVAPDFAVPDRRGRVVHLSQFRGKKVLVLTWASW